MTRKRFYQKLRELSSQSSWDFEGTAIRAYSKDDHMKDFCPITFVCHKITGEYFPSHRFVQAAELIGLDGEDAELIARCADEPNEYLEGYETSIRRALLRAVMNV